MRRLYRLKQRVKLLTDFFVLDTETGTKFKDGSIKWKLNGRPESFQFGVIYGHNFHKVIYSVEEFKQELLDKRYKDKIVFMHNAEYDLNVLYDNIYKFDPTTIFNGKFITASNGNCQFACSMNIFGAIKLANVGKMLGIKKPDLGDNNMFSPKGITSKEINRCLTDCEITYEGLISIFTAANDIKITQASLSMAYFRRCHQPFDIEYNENTTFFYDSYFGGRTEVFKIGPTHSIVKDVNSMYPYWMLKGKFPNPKYLKLETSKGWKQKDFIKYFLNNIIHNYEGLITCKINHAKKAYGFLPHKIYSKQNPTASDKGKLVFPVGRFSGTWNLPEIRFALEHGAIEIEHIEKIVYSQPMNSPFESYVKTLYDERLEAERNNNAFQKYRVKIFMNSLYGKFAQRIDEQCIYIDDVNKRYDDIREYQRNGSYKKLLLFNADRNDAFLILDKSAVSCSYSIPSFASYITTYGRIHLLDEILKNHSRGVVYCDTDSIFFENGIGVESEYRLGGWKVENKIVTEIRTLKDYKYIDLDKDKNKVLHNLKGVPKSADYIEGECYNIEEKDLLPLHTYDYQNLLKTKEALRRNKNPGVLTRRIKKVSANYDKRIILPNGETTPITI